jgi:hypothetical protein
LQGNGRDNVFILGLIVGPVAGLLGGDYLLKTSLGPMLRAVVVALVLVFILFAGFFGLELKAGLMLGLLLGFLLSATPVFAPGEEQEGTAEASA